MRAMGPGSVSSFLKIILDVVYYALFVGLAGLGLALVAGLLLSFNPEAVQSVIQRLEVRGEVDEVSALGPMLVAGFIYITLYVAALLNIVSHLRKVFSTLTAGDPFHPDNIRRLRLIGFVLAGMEIARYLLRAVLMAVAPGADSQVAGLNITVWFAVLVVFVLAEVFREGARLRREAELTI